ncbi:MAG: hypothetical protein V4692_08225, partial [Bdellovibrionota bacterium]
LAVSTVFVSLSAAAGPSICDSPASMQELVKAMQPEAQLTPEKLSEIRGPKRVVLIGDAHYYTDPVGIKSVASAFAATAGSNACMAFELPESTDGDSLSVAIEKFPASLEELRKRADDPSVDAATKARVLQLVQGFRIFGGYFFPIESFARGLGLKTFAIDHKDQFTSSQSMDVRNQTMVDNLSKLLNAGECDSILFMVGKAHIQKQYDTTSGVQPLLAAQGVDSVSLNLQMTRETVPSNSKTFTTCSAPQPKSPSIVDNRLLDPGLSLMPMIQDVPLWSEFDYTVLLP